RETSTRPGRAMQLLGRDEGGHRALGAHPVGHALSLGLVLERAHAHSEADLSVFARRLRDVGVEPCLVELLLQAIGLPASPARAPRRRWTARRACRAGWFSSRLPPRSPSWRRDGSTVGPRARRGRTSGP